MAETCAPPEPAADFAIDLFTPDPRMAARRALLLAACLGSVQFALGLLWFQGRPLLLVAAAAGTAAFLWAATWTLLRYGGVRWIRATSGGLLVRRRGRTWRIRWENVGWARRYPAFMGGRWEFGLPFGREFTLSLEGFPDGEIERFEEFLRRSLPDRIRPEGLCDGLGLGYGRFLLRGGRRSP